MAMRVARRHRRRGRGRALRTAAGAAALIALAATFGFAVFIAGIPMRADDPARASDAIVVLTGGGDRLAEGLRLLDAGKARKLFVSGVPEGVELDHMLASLGRQIDAERLACCVVLGHAADNTAGNARETARWMAGEGFRSLRLVTADYHMPRSLIEFRRALPDAVILGHPVFPVELVGGRWSQWPATANLILREYGKYLLALARGLLALPEGA